MNSPVSHCLISSLQLLLEHFVLLVGQGSRRLRAANVRGRHIARLLLARHSFGPILDSGMKMLLALEHALLGRIGRGIVVMLKVLAVKLKLMEIARKRLMGRMMPLLLLPLLTAGSGLLSVEFASVHGFSGLELSPRLGHESEAEW